MTETTSSPVRRRWSGILVLSIISCGIGQRCPWQMDRCLRSGRSRHTEWRELPFSSAAAFSAASSSISVVSVPFEVTGDGPTISLRGLMSWAEPGRVNELGRRDSDPEDELLK